MPSFIRSLAATPRGVAVALAIVIASAGARAQQSPQPPTPSHRDRLDALDSLVASALVTSPRIRAVEARVRAASTRVSTAGSRPDPMLMAGVQNFPVSEPGFRDFMTMKMLGVGQSIPYPGKLSLRTRVASFELDAIEAEQMSTRLAVEAEVKDAFYDLAYLDRAIAIVDRNQRLLLDLLKVTETKYGVGSGGQEEVLRVQVEAARLSEEAVALVEQRRATLARLNATRDRPSETAIPGPVIPPRIGRAAIADTASQIRFVSSTIGARAADSPIPPLDRLQATAVRQNPMLLALRARRDAQLAREALARKAHLPDFDVTLAYGQRDGFADMISAQVSVPIPLHRKRKQDQLVVESRAELAALEAEHHEQSNAVQAVVARLHSELERDRAQLALYVKAIVPQGQAALSSATAGYQVGRTSFVALLDAQATLFNYELTYYRVLSNFAKTLAELERTLGEEILQ